MYVCNELHVCFLEYQELVPNLISSHFKIVKSLNDILGYL